MNTSEPLSQINYWYLNPDIMPHLTSDIEVDVVVIGGGMAGLSAAHAFLKKKCSVALIEKDYCGGGASGKSSGFITPDSELSLDYFYKKFGAEQAKKIWEFAIGGVKQIEQNIARFNFDCDFEKQATMVVATSKSGMKELEAEHEVRLKLGYPSSLYSASNLSSVLASDKYYGGVAYDDTFGINPFQYCQSMKKHLQKNGVAIYEETPALEMGNQFVRTPHGTIRAKHIVVCVDQFLPNLQKLKNDVYHAQTFIILSEQLSEKTIKSLFPRENFLVWDTDLIYTYFRIIDHNRLMVGGGTLRCSYDKQAHYNNSAVIRKLSNYVNNYFPQLDINFVYTWLGLIGVSKDIRPIAGFDAHDNSLYYIAAAAGLPWAAALGYYSAERIVENDDDFDTYFSPYRSFPIPKLFQYVLGKRLTFALSNAKTIFS